MVKLIRITTVPLSMYLLLKNQLRFLSRHFEVIGISSGGELLDKTGEREGIRTIAVEMTRKITPLQDVISLWKLYVLLKKERPAIVHTLSPKAGLLGMMAAKMAGVPVRIHSIAGLPLLETRGIKRKLLDIIERFTYSCATIVYSNSGKMRDIIITNKYCRPEKIKVIGNGSTNGVDTTWFDPQRFPETRRGQFRNQLDLSPDDLVFSFVGRIVKPKGIEELLTAFDRLVEIDDRVRLIFVGPFDTDKDQLDERLVRKIKHHPHIRWVGFQEDIRPYLAISDAFVFPSHREGFPNVVMQACAMELPCIVSDINGCNELIEDGLNGLVVPPKDPDSLFKAMYKLATDEPLRRSMASAGRRNIVNEFDQQYVFNNLLQEYHSFGFSPAHALVS